MSVDFVLNAERRNDEGKGASRRLRRTGRVPGVIYGAGKDAVSISLNHKDLLKNLESEAFYSHILTVKLDSGEEQAILKDLQRHPSKPAVLHIDLQRVSANEKIRVHVPLHFMGEEVAPGVKQGGGVVAHSLTEVEVSCLPKDLPEFIEVDLSKLDLNEPVHLSELKLPAGVEIVELAHGHDLPVVSIHVPRAAKEPEAAPEEAGEEAPGEEAGGE